VLDVLLHNARILTQDPLTPVAHSIGILGGQVVGLDADVAGLPARSVIDAGGATVTPGFGDAHNHMVWFGLAQAEVDLSQCHTVEDVCAAVAARAQRLPTDAWVLGNGYDHTEIDGHPHRTQLDQAAGGRPVWLKHRSGHQSAVSSVVLERAGQLQAPGRPIDGGLVVRDAGGLATGVLQENAQSIAVGQRGPCGLDELVEAIARASRVYAGEGLTHVVECGIGGGLIGRSPIEALAYQLAREQQLLDVRVDLMPAADVLHGYPELDGRWPGLGLDLGLRTGFGDDRLRLGPVKMWLDGSLVSRTAAMHEPFCDHGKAAGYLAGDAGEMRARLLAAHRAGWRIAAHAIGDQAVDLALDVFEEAQRVQHRPDVRHRIEHAAIVSPDQLERMARLGVVPVPQARFLYEIGDTMAEAVGAERTSWLYRHRSFLDAGMRVPGSSDRPVAAGAPLLGMQSMVERTSRSGHVLSPDERVDAATALRAYTLDAAWASHDEGRRGHLARGALADLVVLSDDPTAVPSSRIGRIEVVATMLAGEFTHGRDRLAETHSGLVRAS